MRKQLPLIKAWAMTINKSQGQTLDRVLLDATAPPFEHGHSYGAHHHHLPTNTAHCPCPCRRAKN